MSWFEGMERARKRHHRTVGLMYLAAWVLFVVVAIGFCWLAYGAQN